MFMINIIAGFGAIVLASGLLALLPIGKNERSTF